MDPAPTTVTTAPGGVVGRECRLALVPGTDSRVILKEEVERREFGFDVLFVVATDRGSDAGLWAGLELVDLARSVGARRNGGSRACGPL